MRTWLRLAAPALFGHCPLKCCLAAALLAFFAIPAQGTEEGELGENRYEDVSGDVLGPGLENYFADSDIDLAAFQQPGATRPLTGSRRPTRRPVAGQETATPTAE